MQISRSENTQAGALSHLVTLDFLELNQEVFIDVFEMPSIKSLPIIQIENEPSWINPLMDYIIKKILLTDLIEARRIKR